MDDTEFRNPLVPEVEPVSSDVWRDRDFAVAANRVARFPSQAQNGYAWLRGVHPRLLELLPPLTTD